MPSPTYPRSKKCWPPEKQRLLSLLKEVFRSISVWWKRVPMVRLYNTLPDQRVITSISEGLPGQEGSRSMSTVFSKVIRRSAAKKRRMFIRLLEWIGLNPSFAQIKERSQPHRRHALPDWLK